LSLAVVVVGLVVVTADRVIDRWAPAIFNQDWLLTVATFNPVSHAVLLSTPGVFVSIARVGACELAGAVVA